MVFDLNNVHSSWLSFFTDNSVLKEINEISAAIGVETFYPEPENVFRFAKNDLDRVESVIVGMDPYPSWNDVMSCPQATGRAFEVSELYGQDWNYKIKQSSLRNILKAIHHNQTGQLLSLEQVRQDIGNGRFLIAAPTEWFDDMERQGVLFLNSTLTVAPDKPGSHAQLWNNFRTLLIDHLLNRGLTWHLWGNNAQNEYGGLIGTEHVLSAPHPRMAQFVEKNTFQDDKKINWLGV